MQGSLADWLIQKLTAWLMRPNQAAEQPICDFERIQYEIRPCDVILVEGRSRVSKVIKAVTQSPWSHSALYIGRLHDIENPVLRARVTQFYDGPPDEQLLIESVLGQGTIVTPLSFYNDEHIRLCRPQGISRADAQAVIGFVIGRLGIDYDIRHILDLARFLFPWSILPRRWRSSLFHHQPGTPTRQICSVLIAEAFMSVRFPILPVFKTSENKKVTEVIAKNPRLYTPSDFDYSPFFEIIKYPIVRTAYQTFPWNEELWSNRDIGETVPKPKSSSSVSQEPNPKQPDAK